MEAIEEPGVVAADEILYADGGVRAEVEAPLVPMLHEHVDIADKAACLARIESMRELREWQDRNLPLYASLLGLDLVRLLVQHHLHERRFTLKDIDLSLPYSQNAVRQHLQRLTRDRWITVESQATDRRYRSVVLSPRLKRVLDRYLQILCEEQQPIL